MTAISSACGLLYDLKILFTYSLKFLNLLYLSSASPLNVGCLIMHQPSVGPVFCFPSALATPMACIVALLLQPLPALLFHWHLSIHLPLYIYVLFLLCLPI